MYSSISEVLSQPNAWYRIVAIIFAIIIMSACSYYLSTVYRHRLHRNGYKKIYFVMKGIYFIIGMGYFLIFMTSLLTPNRLPVWAQMILIVCVLGTFAVSQVISARKLHEDVKVKKQVEAWFINVKETQVNVISEE